MSRSYRSSPFHPTCGYPTNKEWKRKANRRLRIAARFQVRQLDVAEIREELELKRMFGLDVGGDHGVTVTMKAVSNISNNNTDGKLRLDMDATGIRLMRK